ncbi:MAG TPA: tyrosine-protein phosphatase [Acidimicrobiales bacterium]|nr:tyrosine-protein phosphatase [Acidimicrobiales bacterium]
MTRWPTGRARHGGIDEIPLPVGPGRLWLCGKHAIGPDHAGAMAETGADLVVCLCERPELIDRYPAYVEWLDSQSRPDGEAVWFPIPDLHAPSPDRVRPFLEQLAERVQSGRSLLMHCGAGIGRAGTMAAALLMHMGISHGDALSAVASARPMAGPEVGAQTQLLALLASAHR